MTSTARVIAVALALAAASCRWVVPYGSSPRRDVARDEGAACGGTVCKAGEQCCGRPACPRCLSLASDKLCPEICPVDATADKQHSCTLATGCGDRVCDVRSCAFNATGVCQVRPEACDASITRVCGCDGKTYNNDCERLRQSAAWSHDGPCRDATVALDARLDSPWPKGDLPKPKADLPKPKPDGPGPKADGPGPCNGCYSGSTCIVLGQQNENACGHSGQTCKKCGPGLNCDISTGTCVCRPGGLCPGCCSSKTSCVASATDGACGSSGALCVSCLPTWACSAAGICLPPLCLACAGCCDMPTGSCVSNGPTKCGALGGACVDCTGTGTSIKCKNGSCFPVGCTCAGALCCDPVGNCVPGTSDGSCGVNGEACKVCMDLCVAGQCVTGP